MMPAPLQGVRILAVEHMLALPYATQLLGFMGADVLKVEPPGGESGRGSRPLLRAPWGGEVGAIFARANLGKRSIAIDLKDTRGRDLLLQLVPRFDIVAENLRPGALAKMGLSFETLQQARADIVLATLSGFGRLGDSPYSDWPAYAPVVEATAGLYTMGLSADEAFSIGSLGALADVQGGVFAALGMLAALRERDRTGEAQHVDIAMADAAMVLIDSGPLLASLGLPAPMLLGRGLGLQESFAAAGGRFCVTIMREKMFERFATVIGRPGWLSDDRFARRELWHEQVEAEIRPAVEAWARDRTPFEAADELARAGVAVGLVHEARDLIGNAHVERRSMLKAVPLPGHDEPLLVTGNPVKFLSGERTTSTHFPALGEHTAEVLADELGLDEELVRQLVVDGVVSCGVSRPMGHTPA